MDLILDVDWKTVIAVLLGLAVWVYVLAAYGVFFSFIKSGEILLVEEGKSFYKLIPNIPGYGVLGSKIVLCDEKNAKIKKPKSFLGIFWVGFFPLRKIHKYDFSWDKAVSKEEAGREEKKGGKIEETGFAGVILSHRSETVNSIRHKNSYPVIVKEVELAGQFKIDIFFNVIFETVDPVFAVFILNGNWFSLSTSAFRGIISDFVRGMELRKKEEEKKELAVSASAKKEEEQRFFEDLPKETAFNDFVIENAQIISDASGVTPFKVIYRDYAVSGSDASKKAAEALKIAELEALAAKARGKGKGDEKREEKTGEAEGIKAIKAAQAEGLEKTLSAAKKHEQGGDVMIAQEYSDAIRNYGGSTIIFGASNVSPMIPIDNKKEKKRKEGETNE